MDGVDGRTPLHPLLAFVQTHLRGVYGEVVQGMLGGVWADVGWLSVVRRTVGAAGRWRSVCTTRGWAPTMTLSITRQM